MGICDKCLHKEVCGKYIATGGHVKSCEHFYCRGSVEMDGDQEDG